MGDHVYEYVQFLFAKFLGLILNSRRAAGPYLPVTTEEGDLKPPPPLSCFFGPFTSQIRQDIMIFEAFPMCVYHIYDSFFFFADLLSYSELYLRE